MRIFATAAPLLGLTLVLAACSSGGATTAPTAAAAATAAATAAASASAPAASESTAPSMAAAGPVTINLADNPLGKILVDGSGRTLYVFLADSGGASACNDKCATAWPPLVSDGSAPTLGAGLDAGDFATISRTDGATQVTFYGMPLYSFASDSAPGDTKGQGLLSKWYVVGADGKPIK